MGKQQLGNLKAGRERMRDNVARPEWVGQVELACGHLAEGAAVLSSPSRWYCGDCKSFVRERTARKAA